MGRILRWKGRVAHSVLVGLMLFSFQVSAQSLQTSRINYSCKSVSLEKVIEHLSKRTGLYFVYSSNKVSTNSPVTLSLKDKSLQEALTEIEKQLGVTFRIYEHHVTVKSNEGALLNAPIAQAKKLSDRINSAPVYLAANTKKNFEVSEFISQRVAGLPTLQENNEKHIASLLPHFNASLLKKIPMKYVKVASRKMNSGWFVSAGSLINDYSFGFEMQAGLRHAYVVFSPTWMRDDKYHAAMGLGSSIRLSDFFSINPVYTFASVKSSETSTSRFGNPVSYQVQSEISHHQLKLLLQYAVSKNISFRAGATFNQARSTFKFHQQENRTAFYSYSLIGNPPPPGTVDHGDYRIYTEHVPKCIPDVVTNRFWIGWEASISYKLNFYRRK